MRYYSRYISLVLGVVFAAMASSCRTDEVVFPSENENVNDGEQLSGVVGFYLLNEGNMGSNKCTLDYYDFASGKYARNIYAERNPSVVMELGDVGNDLAIYGSKLYAVINCSHKVEVMDMSTGVSIGHIDIPNCRNIVFRGREAYVSSYIGMTLNDPDCPNGAVFRVDTATLAVTGKVLVGFQPEEMAVVGNHLYVANSGGYRPPHYDNTVSVVDLDTFEEMAQIPVGINPKCVKKDSNGCLWVTSQGNHVDIPSKIMVMSPGKNTRILNHIDTIEVAASNLAVKGDSILYFSGVGNSKPSYGVIDVNSRRKISENFITDGTDAMIKMPYGIAVNPISGDIYVTDARNYVSSGTLYCFTSSGTLRWSVRTGDIPAAFAFREY